jgi:hypothetical protein
VNKIDETILKYTFGKILKESFEALPCIQESYQSIRTACEKNFKNYTPDQLDQFLLEQFQKTQSNYVEPVKIEEKIEEAA